MLARIMDNAIKVRYHKEIILEAALIYECTQGCTRCEPNECAVVIQLQWECTCICRLK